METQLARRVESVDRLNGGIIVTFDDGKSAVYSGSLLRATFGQAQDITELEEDEDRTSAESRGSYSP
jgi:hypothetical protein